MGINLLASAWTTFDLQIVLTAFKGITFLLLTLTMIDDRKFLSVELLVI